jgi:hypothetical protein
MRVVCVCVCVCVRVCVSMYACVCTPARSLQKKLRTKTKLAYTSKQSVSLNTWSCFHSPFHMLPMNLSTEVLQGDFQFLSLSSHGRDSGIPLSVVQRLHCPHLIRGHGGHPLSQQLWQVVVDLSFLLTAEFSRTCCQGWRHVGPSAALKRPHAFLVEASHEGLSPMPCNATS